MRHQNVVGRACGDRYRRAEVGWRNAASASSLSWAIRTTGLRRCTVNGMFGRPTYETTLRNTRAQNYSQDPDALAKSLFAAAKAGGFFDWADAEVFQLGRSMLEMGSLASVQRATWASSAPRAVKTTGDQAAMPACAPLPGSLVRHLRRPRQPVLRFADRGVAGARPASGHARRSADPSPLPARRFRRGCGNVDAAAAADGSQREHATRAQQIWLDMERRGVADSWGLLLDFGWLGHGSRHRFCRIPSWRAENSRGVPPLRPARRAGSSTGFSRWRRRPRRGYRWARPTTISTLTR